MNEYILDGETETRRLERQNSKPHYLIDDEISSDEISFQRESKILDVACGTGAFTDYILRTNRNKNLNIEMLDINKSRLNFLQKKIEHKYTDNDINPKYTVGDACSLAAADNTYDVIVNRFLIHHFPKNGLHTKEFISEAYRTLKNGGKLVIIDIVNIMFNIGTTNVELLELLEDFRVNQPLSLWGSLKLPQVMIEEGFRSENIKFETKPILFWTKDDLMSEYVEWSHRFNLMKPVMEKHMGKEKFEHFVDLYLEELKKDGTVLEWSKTITVATK